MLLARTLGYASRSELYERIELADLLEWEADYQIHPWGEEAADARHGILCSLLEACNRVKGAPSPPEEYHPYRDKDARKSDDLMKAIFDQAAREWNS